MIDIQNYMDNISVRGINNVIADIAVADDILFFDELLFASLTGN